MSFLKTYGPALAIVVVITLWMSTGTLVQGGVGPDKGERPVVSLVEKNGGPITKTLEKTGIVHKPEKKTGVNDPALSIAERNALKTSETGTATSVRIKTFKAQPMPLQVTLRGRTKAKAIVSVTAQASGTVEAVKVEKGQKVKKGDLLCSLDKGTRQAAVNQAKAALDQAQLSYDTNAKLREKGFAAPNTKAQMESALASAKANLEQAKDALNKTEIDAPISGVVQEPLADVGSTLNNGGTCATIVQLDPMQFIGSIPEARIGLARTGLPVTVTTIDGQTAKGKVTYIASVADESTRTFEVDAEVPNPDGRILDGLTAEAVVHAGTTPAHLLPQSVLTLNDKGELGVRAVENNKVKFYRVEVAKDTRQGVWVLGLPDTLDIITLGQENVSDGETVKASHADEGQTS